MLIEQLALKIKNEGNYSRIRVQLYDGRFLNEVVEFDPKDAFLKSGKFFAKLRNAINNTRYDSYTVYGFNLENN